MTPSQAKAQGLIVDSTCYPWIGYKGPRFRPTTITNVLTDLEAELVEGISALLLAHDSTHNTHPAIEALRGLLAKLEA